TLSIGAITNGGVAGPLGASSNNPANLVFGGGPVNPSVGGTLQYTGPSATTDRGITLNASGVNAATDFIEVPNSLASLSIAGQVMGTGGLTKTGPGTLTLSGNNSYSGGTYINGGTILVNNAAGTGTGTGLVTVNTGATLGGAGTLQGAVTN